MSSTLRWLPLACAVLVVACGGQSAGTSPTAPVSSSRSPHPGTAPTASSTLSAPPVTGPVPGAVAAGDWLEFDYNAQRSGVGPFDTGITARNVTSLRLRRVDIDGTADSSAIELHAIAVGGVQRDVIVVTTSYGKTIALDAGTGARLWEYVPSDVKAYEGTAQVTTATPIADPDRRYVYAASPDGVIHKLALATGVQVWARKITFDPVHEKIASALNISGNWVVAVTGGYIGDIPPYDGHVVTIDRTSGRIVHVWNTQCSDRHRLIKAASCADTNTHGDSAIWAREGAVIEPGSRRILVATGNGPFDGSTNWGDSVLELSADASRLLHSWTPTNQAFLDANDLDLGSAAPAILPAVNGWRLAVQAGKAGELDLLNLNRLDGTRGGAGPRLGGQLQALPTPGGSEVLTAPAVWTGTGRVYVFVANDSGTTAYVLRARRTPRLGVAWKRSTPGTSPVIAGGLLYVYDELDGSLAVREPTSGILIKSLATGTGHWNSPIVVGGRVILPVGTYHDHAARGVIDIYHLPGL